jgi:hypothetical protein
LATTAFPQGFELGRFFTGVVTRPATAGDDPLFINGARLQALLDLALLGEPIDPASEEFVWVYLVRQNAQAGPAVQPYVVFASGHVPPVSDAQFDLSRFDVSNFALR